MKKLVEILNNILLFFLEKAGIQQKEKALELFWQFFKFGLVGVSNTLVSWFCYYTILFINSDLYLLGSIIGTVVSIANAFFWNDKFVFSGNRQDWRSKLKRLGKTYVSYGGTSLLSNVMLWVEVTFFHVSKTIAPIVNIFVTIPLNFVINKLWTFRDKSV